MNEPNSGRNRDSAVFLPAGSITLALRGESTCGIMFEVQDGPEEFPTKNVRLGKVVLEPKMERHVSLVAGNTGSLLRSLFKADEQLQTAVEEYIQSWNLVYQRTGQLYQARRVDSVPLDGRRVRRYRETIIERVSILDAEEFYENLAQFLPPRAAADLAVPPHHVTLYTLHCPEEPEPERLGISITSEREWQERVVRQIHPEELEVESE